MEPPAVLVGAHAEQGDILGFTDETGEFALSDIPPGNYYLAVWAPYNWILVPESSTDSTPRLITLEPDERLNLGVVYLSWP
jgi:hypothetical protein